MSQDGALRSVVAVRDWLGDRAVSRLADFDSGLTLRVAAPSDGFRPLLDVSDASGRLYRLTSSGGGGGEDGVLRGDWGLVPALDPRVTEILVTDPTGHHLVVDLDSRRPVRPVPTTARSGAEDELFVTHGHCTFCFEPGRSFCERCKGEHLTPRPSLPLLPDVVVPLAASAGRVLDVDLYVMALESFASSFTLEMAWFGRWPWTLSSQRPPFMRRWEAEDDAGTRYGGSVVGCGNGMAGGDLLDVHFLPGLHPDASTLTLVMPSPGRDPLVTITVDL